MTLAQAKRALSHADCGVGKIRKPKHVPRHHVMRVSGQSSVFRSRHPAGYRVNISLK
jgi:hypothetical protein